ncbi:MAG: anthranilate synthase family protein [Kineosporiaceae bacterium]
MSDGDGAAYCYTHRQGTTVLYRGELVRVRRLDDLPQPRPGLPVISLVPYAQIRERGFLTQDGDEPILSLVVSSVEEVDVATLPDVPVTVVEGPVVEPSDAEFEDVVQRIIDDEIRRGEGSNFLISRRSQLRLADFSADVAHTILRRLARNEANAYLTFCFSDGGDSWFIGASPERHLTHRDGTVWMNPICGTLPRPALTGKDALLEFLTDAKEVNELFQVVDEELKIMSRISSAGGVIHGPFLKEMGEVVHTEYVLEGAATLPPIAAFRESMFAPTMVGSPLENAARIIHKYEPESRRYYSSAILLHEVDDAGRETLDSAITIRTMEVSAQGVAQIRSGASVVRDSVPAKERAEVTAKAAGMLRALGGGEPGGPMLEGIVDDEVRAVLAGRNDVLSRFWMDAQGESHTVEALVGRSVLIVDNEDQFTEMLGHIIERLGMKVTMARHTDILDVDGHDMVLVGPGPGDPNDLDHPKMATIHRLTRELLASGKPFLSVCLGHQVLCRSLGLAVEPHDPPLQGVQQVVDLFGVAEPVGFYNTFFGRVPAVAPEGVEVSAWPDGRVVAVRADRFVGFQFHVESVLTRNCTSILRGALEHLLVR